MAPGVTAPRVGRWGDGMVGWAYDCPACGRQVRGLFDPRRTCQQCGARVESRRITPSLAELVRAA